MPRSESFESMHKRFIILKIPCLPIFIPSCTFKLPDSIETSYKRSHAPKNPCLPILRTNVAFSEVWCGRHATFWEFWKYAQTISCPRKPLYTDFQSDLSISKNQGVRGGATVYNLGIGGPCHVGGGSTVYNLGMGGPCHFLRVFKCAQKIYHP